MEQITVIKLTPDELKNLISEAVREGSEGVQSSRDKIWKTFLNMEEICVLYK